MDADGAPSARIHRGVAAVLDLLADRWRYRGRPGADLQAACGDVGVMSAWHSKL